MDMHELAGRERGPRGMLATISGLILYVVMLVVATFAANALAATIVGCLAVSALLLLTLGSIRRERAQVESSIRQVHTTYSAIISALMAAVGLRDDMSASHARQVSDLASIVAQQMGVRNKEVQLIQRAAILADIGKTEVVEGILSKAGQLSEEEWAEMQRHPELGSRTLAEIFGFNDAAEIVLAHHERFDGQGYPNHLKGEDIPLGSRIYTVAEAYIAMTSDRPHRKKMSHESAMQEVVRNSLTQFDPDVVRAFVTAEEMGLLGERRGSTNGEFADPKAAVLAGERGD